MPGSCRCGRAGQTAFFPRKPAGLITLIVGLETLTLPLYVLVGLAASASVPTEQLVGSSGPLPRVIGSRRWG